MIEELFQVRGEVDERETEAPFKVPSVQEVRAAMDIVRRGLIGRDGKELAAFSESKRMVEQSLNSILKQSTLDHFF